jgi:hypothetical protein
MNGLKKHLNIRLMLKVGLIYLELLGFTNIDQSPCLVKSFIVFSFFVFIQHFFLMICLLNLFCYQGYLLHIVFTKAKKVHPYQREVCATQEQAFCFLYGTMQKFFSFLAFLVTL